MRRLLGNPLLDWHLQHLRRERRPLIGLAVAAAVFYAVAFISFLVWTTQWSPKLRDLLTTFHYEAWGVNAFALLLYAPASLAQRLARERERGTLDMLRLTGLPGTTQALGLLSVSLSLPLALVALSAPVILLGLGGEGGPAAALRGYTGLLLLAPVYTLIGGLLGLSVKKAQNAGSTVVFVLGALIVISGVTIQTDVRALAALGPWGAGLATTRAGLFDLHLFGGEVPGELVMVPVLGLIGWGCFRALACRLTGAPGLLLGRRGAMWVGGGVAALAALTTGPWLEPEGLFPRLLALFVGLLLIAVEAPVSWKDLVRGLARRGPDDPPRPDERLTPARYVPIGAVAAAAGLALLPAAARDAGATPAGVLMGSLVAALAALVVALTFQASILVSKDRGAPRGLAAVALLVAWCAPFVASLILGKLGLDGAILEVPRILNPIYGLFVASMHAERSLAAALSLDPLAQALGCAAFHVFAAVGLQHLIRQARERAQERADSLVALPADAYGAPGTLTRRCPAGHLYAETWASCPHCGPA